MWTIVPNIDDVLGKVPNRAVQEDECSIPDVYGKAIQFHLALKQDYNGQENRREVNIWRGLITLLALQGYYNFPVSWEEVKMPEGKNLYCDSLKLIPEHFSIFSDPKRQWDGKTFYVLTWKKSNGVSVDLFLYSPATLVYPVADWSSVFSQLPEIEWFDRENGFAAPERVLGESDKKIVAYWLEKTIALVQKDGNQNSPSTQMILDHLRRYSSDLHVVLQKKDRRSLETAPMNKDTSLSTVLGTLNHTVEVMLHFGADRVPASSLFSDQICYFRNSKDDIFQMCSCRDSYKVEPEDHLYAFLPLDPTVRKYCGPFNLAAGVTMTCIRKGKRDNADYIRAQIAMPNNVGMDLVKDYKMVDRAGANKGEAFSYFDNSIGKTTDRLPLIAIWPNKICDIWKRYYIMLDDELAGSSLEIADDPELERTKNNYVVQTKYVPDAIPLVRQYGRRGEGGPVLSIGMLSPRTERIPHDENLSVSAEVAVDFGTSSTRVFAKIDGVPEKEEIFITDDGPLMIMTYGGEQNIMRNYFVANQDPSSQQDGDNKYEGKIFSIYKRDDRRMKITASPILDGVIYQAKPDERLEDQGGSYVDRLMTNLKWGDKNNRPYYKAFLEQLCLHVTSLLYQKYHVNQITWRYAIPEVMAPTSKQSIETVWTNNVKGYLESMTDKITCQVAQKYETESEAASRYFLYDGGENANAEKGYLVMDIGGGSTDLALWQGTLDKCDMKWHDSVDVAGHSIFTRWVAEYLSQFKGLATDETLKNMISEVEKHAGTGGPNGAQNALVDRILTVYSSALQGIYTQECDGGRAGDWAVELCGRIIHGVSILFFAVGYQVGLLAKDGVLKISDQPGTFVIAVGGRGARILDWADKVCSKGAVSQIFFDLGCEAAIHRSFSPIKVQISQDPKSEVARGLLDGGRGKAAPGVGGRNGQETSISVPSVPEADYERLFLQFAKDYKGTFGDLYPLPDLTEDSARDMLNRYSGDRRSLINVFMQVLYKCWAVKAGSGGRSQC